MPKVQSKKPTTKKSKYKITNWSFYNRSLIGRGDITIWIDSEVSENWYHQGPNQKGAQVLYSDDCIECLMALKSVFHLAYRQLEGFSNSILKLMNLELEVPSYSQINRRAKELEIALNIVVKKGEKVHVVFDSTGLKVFGEGEWKERKHGLSKRKTWRKLHLGVDEKTGIIHAQVLTENDIDDASQLEPMLGQIKQEIDKVGADGAYDKTKCWDILNELNIAALIPPREDAVYWVDEQGNLLDHQRNKILKYIDDSCIGKWEKQSGYFRRNLSETAMMRFKTIFGGKLFSKEIKRQKVEAAIKIKALNKMILLGKPITVKVS
jgi:hypothetical protein